MKKFYSGKYVVVTGGSSGIGRSLANQLVQLGASLCLVARRKPLLEEAAAALSPLCTREGQVVETLPLDLSDREATTSALKELSERRDIDILINNAGVAYANYIDKTNPSVYEEMMRINYFGTVWATCALLDHFKKRKRGNIANVASLAGVLGIFGYAAYAPSKFAVMGFSDVLRQELRPDGITVSVLLPPDTMTPQLEYENRTKPAETKAIAGAVKPKHPDVVAEAFLQGIAAGKFHIVPGMDSKLPYYATRLIPGVVRWFTDSDVQKARKTRADGE